MRCGCLQLKPLPLASQGGSATRNDERLGHRLLRLRCAPPLTTANVIHPKASESGHVKRSFTSPPVASARRSRVRRCGGSLWCGQRKSERARAREAQLHQPASRERSNNPSRPPRIHSEGRQRKCERKRAREAQLHQPASRERSNNVALKIRSRDAGSTPLPSAAPQRSLALQTSVESIRRCRDRGTS